MNFVATLEEYLRDIAYMARSSSTSKKSLPSVKEASERAIQKLRQLQANYITAVRLASSSSTTTSAQQQYPTTALFQSSDLLHPFLLVLNYPNAEYSILEKSFRAIRLLMEHDVIVPTDAIHILRVYQIQAIVVTTFYHNHNNNSSHHSHQNKLSFITKSRRKQKPSSTNTSNSLNDDDDGDDDDDDDEDDDAGEDESHDTTDVVQQQTSSPTKNSDAVSVTTTITKDDDDDDDDNDTIQTQQRPILPGDVAPSSTSSGTTPSTPTSSISTWFGWGTSTTTMSNETTAESAGHPRQQPTRNSFIINRNAVSSSNGGVGSGTNLSAKHMESLALEILSSLVQLMELLRNHHPFILQQSIYIWTNATALACLFGFQWYTPIQQQQLSMAIPTSSSTGSIVGGNSSSTGTSIATTSRQGTVQQAAYATDRKSVV